jgi:hypothetical protein
MPQARLGELTGGGNLGDDFKSRHRAPSDRARRAGQKVKPPSGKMLAGVAAEHRDLGLDDARRPHCQNQPLDPASNAITPRWAVGLISRNAVKADPNGTARLVPELRHAVRSAWCARLRPCGGYRLEA